MAGANLKCSQELIDAFNNACQGNVRYVQAIIENESIVLNATSAVSGTAEEDFNNTIAKEIADGKFATEEELKDIEKKIDLEISESVKNALEAPEPPSEELTKYIWAEDEG